jgi:hypothetical protein
MAYIGPVTSYYQKITNDFERFTDEKWDTIVRNHNSPSRPDWVNSYLADQEGSKYSAGRVLEGVKYLSSAVLNKELNNKSALSVKSTKSGKSILLTLNKSSNIHISLFDVRGRTIMEPISREYTAGTHLLSLPVASGFYTMKVKCGNSHYTIPITSIK